MPRFFFDLRDGEHRVQDDEGSDLLNREAARREALGAISDITRNTSPDGSRRDIFVDVRDEAGNVVFTATLLLVARWLDRLPDE